MRTIGIRELRQHASRYLRLAEGGETIQITDRGRPLAQLVPVPPKDIDVLDRLEREGRLIRAKRGLADLGPPLPARPGQEPLNETLARMRRDERW
ncbi:MAG: type II toxin-antitoxin system Phd/YefM family antitoxin [Egibacteraceae bacterium]